MNGCRTLPRSARWLLLPVGLSLAAILVLTSVRPARAAVAISAINALSSNVVAYGASPDHTKVAAQHYVNGNNSTVRGAVYSAGTLTQLALAGDFPQGYGRDVNDAGVAVGVLSAVSYLPGTDARGFVNVGGVTQLLPTLPGSGFTLANGINNAGTIVGESNLRPFRAALGDAALTELAVPAGGDGTGGALGISPQGDVIVGWRGVSAISAALARRPAAWINNVPTLLDLPAGAVAGEAMLAGPDTIVGIARFQPAGQIGWVDRAAIYDPDGGAVDLGTLSAGGSSEPLDVNSHGWIVGSSGTHPLSRRAFLYQNGLMTDLNTLLPPNSGWVLERAFSINDAGDIIGVGRLQNISRGFHMTGVPEPALGGTIFIAAALLARRRR